MKTRIYGLIISLGCLSLNPILFSSEDIHPELNDPSNVWVTPIASLSLRVKNIKQLVQEMNKAIEQQLGHARFIHARVDESYKTHVIRHDPLVGPHRDQVNQLVAFYANKTMPVPKTLRPKKKALYSSSSFSMTDCAPIDSLKIMVEDMGYYLIESEKDLIVSPQPEGPHTQIVKLPSTFRPLAKEIISDGQARDVTTFFVSKEKHPKGYVIVVDENTLFSIGPSEFCQTLTYRHSGYLSKNWPSFKVSDMSFFRREFSHDFYKAPDESILNDLKTFNPKSIWTTHLETLKTYGDNLDIFPYTYRICGQQKNSPAVFFQQKHYNSITLSQVSPNEFVVVYREKISHGKYYSEDSVLQTSPLQLGNNEMVLLFETFKEGRLTDLSQILKETYQAKAVDPTKITQAQ